jgi:tripartite-type tricarboxylate transporter receptor subunit TctC
VEGHKGAPDIRLAAERGDVAGFCVVWETAKVVLGKALESGEAVPVLQVAPKRHPDLPSVPLAIELAKSDEARDLIRVGVHNPAKIIRLLAAPPGTPAERVHALRKAFLATLQDAEFLAEARRAKLEVEALSGEEVQKIVMDYRDVSPVVRKKLQETLLRK